MAPPGCWSQRMCHTSVRARRVKQPKELVSVTGLGSMGEALPIALLRKRW